MSADYLKVATEAAKGSGAILKNYFGQKYEAHQKNENARDIETEVDYLSEKNIREHISQAYPDHAFAGEEFGRNHKSEYVWHVDPIDGTVNFNQGIPWSVVSIALVFRGELMAGVIYDPFAGELFTAAKSQGAFLNNKRISVSPKTLAKDGLYVGAFSSSRGPEKRREYEIFGQINDNTRGALRIGSAALALAFLACGRLDGFWAINPHSWDVAAGMILVKEAGGKVTDFANTEAGVETKKICASNSRIHDEFLKLLT